VEKVERRSRITPFVVDAEPAVVVSRMQDEGETIVDLRNEFVGFGGDQGEGFEAGTIGPLPRVPDACEGKGAGFGEGFASHLAIGGLPGRLSR
jgi:hypothetical protein